MEVRTISKPVTITQDFVVIELTKEQAAALCAVLGRISGHRKEELNTVIDGLYGNLRRVVEKDCLDKYLQLIKDGEFGIRR